MKLQEVANKAFKGKDIKLQTIGFLTFKEDGTPNTIIPDYADEILETHGQKEVKSYRYVDTHHCLVVEL